jgi:hypothetical protein
MCARASFIVVRPLHTLDNFLLHFYQGREEYGQDRRRRFLAQEQLPSIVCLCFELKLIERRW